MNETRQNELIADRVLLENSRQQPAAFSHGRGSEVRDVSGRRYLDMTAGIAVCGLGHPHPALVRAVAEQAEKLVHVSNPGHLVSVAGNDVVRFAPALNVDHAAVDEAVGILDQAPADRGRSAGA